MCYKIHHEETSNALKQSSIISSECFVSVTNSSVPPSARELQLGSLSHSGRPVGRSEQDTGCLPIINDLARLTGSRFMYVLLAGALRFSIHSYLSKAL